MNPEDYEALMSEEKATKAANPRRTMAGPPPEGWRATQAHVDIVKATIKAVGSDHYKNGGVEPWDLIHDAGLNFDEGNVVKYVCRHRRKDGITDLKKAMTYLRALALHEYGEEL